MKREMNHQISDPRHPALIRFGGYRSKWLQDFNRCPRVLQHLSNITGDVELIPTTLQSNYSHTNIGYANMTTVDHFHRDSVPYVLILLASDMTNTVGGELQLIERQHEEAFRLIEQYEGKVLKEFIRSIDYLGSNSCVFMQGCRIVHGVTGIESCTELRITVVNSYMSSNLFVVDHTRYETFRKEKTDALEFAMHKMWRSYSQIYDLGSGKPS
ncbi:unnamed protein product [Adineta steineri]|uniref:Uncharacterized protein n=1 Tax=Adineta steineri TaxID=433720 RepID=A0A819YUV9_9BILA|nr:unnamed protein product [Adineta steineri]